MGPGSDLLLHIPPPLLLLLLDLCTLCPLSTATLSFSSIAGIYSFPQSRNPDADKRPSFSSIVQYLNQPEGTLLHWSETDKTKSPSCAILGAELGAGHALYQDLQQRYSVPSIRKPRHHKAKVDTLDEKTMLDY